MLVVYLEPNDFTLALKSGSFLRDYLCDPKLRITDSATVHNAAAMPCQGPVLKAQVTAIEQTGSRWQVTFICCEMPLEPDL